ncbi:MAG: phospho-sugar mutase [Clostridiales bacterium]|jgi:phosphoglucomutase|nr:phospho-sugar mutase [Clostridiales bacterium]
MDYHQVYAQWLASGYFDPLTRAELESIQGNEREIQDRFYKTLEFGTGGLRGVIGAGTNRMNIYTIRIATQGLANYILKNAEAREPGRPLRAALAYDSRRCSPEFAQEAALVLNGNGIATFLFESLRPTPELSFAVRFLDCAAGIMITASHNPPEYNGYKAYWSDGGQIPYPRDEEIIREVNLVTDFASIKVAKREDAEKTGLFNIIGREVDDAYIAKVKEQRVDLDLIKRAGAGLKVVYTPLHGAGNIPVRRALKESGFNNVTVVPEQELPDPDFTTVGYPNPEDPKAFELAIKLASKLDADIIVGTDPDSDRLGAVVKNKAGEYVVLTGNMIGALLTEYILSKKKAAGTLPENGAVISTIVSTDLTRAITQRYGAAYIEVLTGFKYIGERIKEFEQTGSHQFLFGFEESYGFLAGTHARDKDAVVAALLICELAACYKERGLSLWDAVTELYEQYGYYVEKTTSITLKGVEGAANIVKIMSRLRENPPDAINRVKVVEIRDYKNRVSTDLVSGAKTPVTLPVSDVVYYILADSSWFCVRPSGTEPKIKIYFGVKDSSAESAQKRIDGLIGAAAELVKA